MQYITVRITGPTHPYLDTQVAAAAMLLGNARREHDVKCEVTRLHAGSARSCWFEPAGDALRPGVSHVFHTWGIVPGHDTHLLSLSLTCTDRGGHGC